MFYTLYFTKKPTHNKKIIAHTDNRPPKNKTQTNAVSPIFFLLLIHTAMVAIPIAMTISVPNNNCIMIHPSL